MTAKPTLLLDMDGPLADFDLAFWNLCQSRGWDMDIDSPRHPNAQRFMSANILDPGHRAQSRRAVQTPGWFRSLPIVEGALDGVENLSEVFDIWVCTKPLEANPSCRDDKARWLRDHIPWLEDRLIITPRKSLCSGLVLLDDAPKLECATVADWDPVLFEAPYNGPTSEWGFLPRWTWGDPVEGLLVR